MARPQIVSQQYIIVGGGNIFTMGLPHFVNFFFKLIKAAVYLAVSNCQGLDYGLYRYGPHKHSLDVIPAEASLCPLFEEASRGAGIKTNELQVLIVIAARIDRVAWKYSSIVYSTILKNVGALFTTMYLNATALNLAPCALGCGNSDTFAEVVGRGYFDEPSVGEFLIGSRPVISDPRSGKRSRTLIPSHELEMTAASQ